MFSLGLPVSRARSLILRPKPKSLEALKLKNQKPETCNPKTTKHLDPKPQTLQGSIILD